MAILNMLGCAAAVVDRPSATNVMVWVSIEMVMIAGATLQWYLYWRAYIDFRLQVLTDKLEDRGEEMEAKK